MACRRKSVPFKSSQPTKQGQDNDRPLIPAFSSTSPPLPGTQGLKPFAQAEALAKMTFELNLRAVGAQAERVEREVKALVLCTGQDKEFREKHERRLQELWREILAVKTRITEVEGQREGERVEDRERQADVIEAVERLRRDMGSLKGWVGNLSSQLDRLPTLAEAEKLSMSTLATTNPSGVQPRPVETRSMLRAKQGPAEPGPSRSKTRHPHQTPKHRIEEAKSSTRRWHRDHKTTKLSDTTFVTNYLKQQSKRDPAMAVCLQKILQRRIQVRQPRSRSRPESLEEFCQGVAWGDVLGAVEALLVKDEGAAVEALREEDKKLR